MFKDSATQNKYMKYNEKFEEWFSQKNGKKAAVNESSLRDFVATYIDRGKDTHMLIAALSFRFKFCEKMKLSFRGLRKKSAKQKPHRVIPKEHLADIFQRTEATLDVCAAFHLLYDLAARL